MTVAFTLSVRKNFPPERILVRWIMGMIITPTAFHSGWCKIIHAPFVKQEAWLLYRDNIVIFNLKASR
ncbi:hypothetical protein ACOSQ2_026727 [Xanthoceras sorbifolium]